MSSKKIIPPTTRLGDLRIQLATFFYQLDQFFPTVPELLDITQIIEERETIFSADMKTTVVEEFDGNML